MAYFDQGKPEIRAETYCHGFQTKNEVGLKSLPLKYSYMTHKIAELYLDQAASNTILPILRGQITIFVVKDEYCAATKLNSLIIPD